MPGKEDEETSSQREELIMVNPRSHRLYPKNTAKTKTGNISELNRHLVKSFLDIIVLVLIRDFPQHGYGIIAEIHKQFGVLLSPGTLYPLLYGFENEGWVKVTDVDQKKVYSLTLKGTENLNFLSEDYLKLFEKLVKIMRVRSNPSFLTQHHENQPSTT
jgi:DNA-binding PadR family transcriptional regulator